MNMRTVGAIIVLLVILGVVFLIQLSDDDNQNSSAEVVLSATAFNQTKNQDATQVSAQGGDEIVYTLDAENKSSEPATYVIEANIADIQELATLTDAQGANYNPSTGSLIWTPIDIEPDDSVQKLITVKVNNTLPASSDRVMSLKFGNDLTVAVTQAQASSNSGQAQGASFVSPNSGMGAGLSLVLAGIISLAAYFYKRQYA